MKTSAAENNEAFRVIEGGAQDGLVGHTIDGRYRVDGVLGEGGMGLVYRGTHVVLNKPLAIKVLRPDVSKDAEIIARFKQEAQSATAIGNQHIIDISDFGALPDGSTYFIMEFLDGIDLTKAIEKQSPMPFPRIVHVMRQLCAALGAAHDAGIVHRDLKPDNIYLIKRGQDKDFVKVLDFGIAKVGGASSKLTRAGQVFGTPHYMSPEQCGGLQLDHRTDIYAIGIILYEMITGRTPFDAENLMGILSKHIYEQAKAPRELRPDCPPDLEAIVMRCIAKKPDERYGHCHELGEDLARLDAGVTPLASGRTYTALTPSSGPAEVAAPAPKSKAPMMAGGAFALLALVGGGGFFATRGNDAPAAQPVVAAVAAPAPAPAAGAGASNNAPAAPAAVVQIITEPAGAELWSGSSMLGQTPLDIPRPGPGEQLQIELKASGYESRQITISSMTVAPQLRFTLTPVRGTARSSSGGSRPSSGGSAPAAAPAPTRRSSGGGGDTVDPWAD